MKGKDEIKDLFSDKLGGYEAKVNPELWANVASQIGAGSAATATGMSLTTKLIIGLGAASVVTATSVVLLSNDDTKKEDPVVETQVAENRVEEKKQDLKEDVVSEPSVGNNDTPSDTYVYTPEPTVLPNTPSEPIYTPDPDPDPTPAYTETSGPVHVIVEEPQMLSAPDPIYPDAHIEDPVVVPEEELITKESQEIDVVFPNVFTPNNDGINDYLFIKNPEELNGSSFNIVVLDSKNKEVFTSTDPYFKWNGYSEFRGEMLAAGRYIAIITCEDKDGRPAKPVMRMFTIVK